MQGGGREKRAQKVELRKRILRNTKPLEICPGQPNPLCFNKKDHRKGNKLHGVCKP